MPNTRIFPLSSLSHAHALFAPYKYRHTFRPCPTFPSSPKRSVFPGVGGDKKSEMASSSLLLISLLVLSAATAGDSLGVNYGTLGDNLPPPSQVAAFLRDRTIIDLVKLFGTDPAQIAAFAHTGILVTVTVPNGDIPALARLPAARDWVQTHIAPFHPATRIHRIAVGNEIMATADKNLIAHLLPAMKSLHAALRLAGIQDVQVSTPHSLGILSTSEPPSVGRFRRGYDKAVFAPMLEFHRRTKSPFMINPYPYFGFNERTLNYALFKPNSGIHDPATGITYTNMFDAMLDAVYTAMKRLGYGDVDIVVAETGWPSLGDPNQPAVNMANAVSFNGNLVRHVLSGKGTPLMPGRKFDTYIFALFNENLKPGSTAERNFGLFYPDFTPVYDVGIMKGGKSGGGGAPALPAPSGSGARWCVAVNGASDRALQSNIDWVCSLGTVDCRPIQAGGPCFQPNSVQSHASYAMNAYFQSVGRHPFNCDFGHTGTITSSDPSYAACKFSS